MKPVWNPVPYYYTGPLSKVSAPVEIPHKLGFIPKYLKKKGDK